MPIAEAATVTRLIKKIEKRKKRIRIADVNGIIVQWCSLLAACCLYCIVHEFTQSPDVAECTMPQDINTDIWLSSLHIKLGNNIKESKNEMKLWKSQSTTNNGGLRTKICITKNLNTKECNTNKIFNSKWKVL